MVSAVIFDCFGVLITEALSVICAEQGVTDAATLNEISDQVHAMNYGYIGQRHAEKQVATLLGITQADYRQRISAGEVKNQSLLTYIANLRPQYKTAMLSNVSNKQSLYDRFEPQELNRVFNAVAVSGEIGFAKPSSEAYLYVAKALGVSPEQCVMIDDQELYCQAAISTGMQAVHYENPEQLMQALKPILNEE